MCSILRLPILRLLWIGLFRFSAWLLAWAFSISVWLLAWTGGAFGRPYVGVMGPFP